MFIALMYAALTKLKKLDIGPMLNSDNFCTYP